MCHQRKQALEFDCPLFFFSFLCIPCNIIRNLLHSKCLSSLLPSIIYLVSQVFLHIIRNSIYVSLSTVFQAFCTKSICKSFIFCDISCLLKISNAFTVKHNKMKQKLCVSVEFSRFLVSRLYS